MQVVLLLMVDLVVNIGSASVTVKMDVLFATTLQTFSVALLITLIDSLSLQDPALLVIFIF